MSGSSCGARMTPRKECSRPPDQVVAHMDLFWTSLIFRDGAPLALIDWELARPATRSLELALAATYWAGLRIDEQLIEWGIPLERRGERLRLLCDAYGLDRAARASLLDELIVYRRQRIASGITQQPQPLTRTLQVGYPTQSTVPPIRGSAQ